MKKLLTMSGFLLTLSIGAFVQAEDKPQEETKAKVYDSFSMIDFNTWTIKTQEGTEHKLLARTSDNKLLVIELSEKSDKVLSLVLYLFQLDCKIREAFS